MQPNPLSPPQEEKQPESVSPEQEQTQPDPYPEPDTHLPEPLSAPANVQPVSPPVPAQAVAKPVSDPVPAKKPPKWGSIATILLGLFVVFLLVVVAGLGFWAYTLNTRLATTQQQLTALQGEYDKLKTDHATLTSDKEKLDADLTQTKAALEKANADLATAQADLKKSQDQNKALTARMSKASKLANVLYDWFNFTMEDAASDLFKIDAEIKDTDDTKLNSLWKQFMTSVASNKRAEADNKIGELLLYLVTAIRDDLK